MLVEMFDFFFNEEIRFDPSVECQCQFRDLAVLILNGDSRSSLNYPRNILVLLLLG